VSTCPYCKEVHRVLTSHIINKHGKSVADLRREYPGTPLLDEDVVARAVCSRDYVAAKIKTAKTFERYAGGHPMRDPQVLSNRSKVRELTGPVYNKAKARETTLKNHGVEHYSQTESARAKSRENMKKLHAEGKSHAGKNRKVCPAEDLLRDRVSRGVLLKSVANEFGVSSVTLAKWCEEMGIDTRRGDHTGEEETWREEMRAHTRKGGSPARSALSKLHGTVDYPLSATTAQIEHHFGSWSEFVSYCEVTPARQGLPSQLGEYLQSCKEVGSVLTGPEFARYKGAPKYAGRVNKVIRKVPGFLDTVKDFLDGNVSADDVVSSVCVEFYR